MFAANRTDIAGILFQAAGQYVRGADKVRQYILGIVETMPKVYLHSARYEIVADDISMCVWYRENILPGRERNVRFFWKRSRESHLSGK